MQNIPLIHYWSLNYIRFKSFFFSQLINTNDYVIVKHYHYITWPDHGVPQSLSPFMTLNRRVMASWNRTNKRPIIVHCSAGVGRTGTFVAVDMALEQADKEGKVDIAGIVTRMRQQRMKMVQTDVSFDSRLI